jgi:thiosulfate dehydrogenase (quinone) large subunit
MEVIKVTSVRNMAVPLGIVAAVLILLLVNPWVTVADQYRSWIGYAFWIVGIALLVVLYMAARSDPDSDTVEIEGPAFARFLFNNSRAGMFWLPIRLFLGFEWLEAGWHKLTGTGWMDGGGALAGFWTAAVKVPDSAAGRPPITYEWYRDFINFMLTNHYESWFAPLVTFGEIAVGLGLIFGCLTGVAAFFGAMMNMSFLLAGSASVNPIMFALAIGLILAWKVAGYYGVDRWLLPLLGTPWRPGAGFVGGRSPATT